MVVQQIGRTIGQLKQNFHFASTVADRHYVIEQGRIIDMISNAGSQANTEKLHSYGVWKQVSC